MLEELAIDIWYTTIIYPYVVLCNMTNITYRYLQITRVPPGRYTFQVPTPKEEHANWQIKDTGSVAGEPSRSTQSASEESPT